MPIEKDGLEQENIRETEPLETKLIHVETHTKSEFVHFLSQ